MLSGSRKYPANLLKILGTPLSSNYNSFKYTSMTLFALF